MGARADEEGSRSKERYFSPRDKNNDWDVGDQPPEFWNQFKTDFAPGTHVRIHPLLDWTELNIWEYIQRENIPTVSLYYDQGDGTRYRILGCGPCQRRSNRGVKNVDDIIAELKSGELAEHRGALGRLQDGKHGGWRAATQRVHVMAPRSNLGAAISPEAARALSIAHQHRHRRPRRSRQEHGGRATARRHRRLPQGKLEAVRRECERTGKPFEYAFLLDALSDEQDQGITIDTARCFFKTAKRDYIIIDAPGHIEFLKNMISGAARAEAAVLVIDAKEGVRENSRRHGYILSMLGIRQMVVGVNKMDLVDYAAGLRGIRDEYRAFLAGIGAVPRVFVPIAAFPGREHGEPSGKTPWYNGPELLSAVDAFEKAPSKNHQPFRMPVEEVYKFTAQGDDRRIFAGRVESGTLGVGDEVVFLPSGKRSRIQTLEGFNTPTAWKSMPARPPA